MCAYVCGCACLCVRVHKHVCVRVCMRHVCACARTRVCMLLFVCVGANESILVQMYLLMLWHRTQRYRTVASHAFQAKMDKDHVYVFACDHVVGCVYVASCAHVVGLLQPQPTIQQAVCMEGSTCRCECTFEQGDLHASWRTSPWHPLQQQHESRQACGVGGANDAL